MVISCEGTNMPSRKSETLQQYRERERVLKITVILNKDSQSH